MDTRTVSSRVSNFVKADYFKEFSKDMITAKTPWKTKAKREEIALIFYGIRLPIDQNVCGLMRAFKWIGYFLRASRISMNFFAETRRWRKNG